MSKSEILSATDEQLNTWCAEKVMGWELDTSTAKGYWEWHNEDWSVSRYKEMYRPIADLVQGIALLDKIQRDTGMWWQIGSPLSVGEGYHVMVMGDMRKGYPRVAASRSDESLPRAIVTAALLAMEWMQEEI